MAIFSMIKGMFSNKLLKSARKVSAYSIVILEKMAAFSDFLNYPDHSLLFSF